MKKFGRLIILFITLVFFTIQFIQPLRTNPPVRSDIQTPDNIKTILRRACYDCHSNETQWPWYSEIAPVAWLVADDVNKGRKHLNFSQWGGYDEFKQGKKLEEIVEEIESGEMPLGNYTLLHPSAKLTKADIRDIKIWAKMSMPH